MVELIACKHGVIKLCLAYDDDKFSAGSGTSASGSIWGHLLYSFHRVPC